LLWFGSCSHCTWACFLSSKLWTFFIKPWMILLQFIQSSTLPYLRFWYTL
jgi:hypothetical protein